MANLGGFGWDRLRNLRSMRALLAPAGTVVVAIATALGIALAGTVVTAMLTSDGGRRGPNRAALRGRRCRPPAERQPGLERP